MANSKQKMWQSRHYEGRTKPRSPSPAPTSASSCMAPWCQDVPIPRQWLLAPQPPEDYLECHGAGGSHRNSGFQGVLLQPTLNSMFSEDWMIPFVQQGVPQGFQEETKSRTREADHMLQIADETLTNTDAQVAHGLPAGTTTLLIRHIPRNVLQEWADNPHQSVANAQMPMPYMRMWLTAALNACGQEFVAMPYAPAVLTPGVTSVQQHGEQAGASDAFGASQAVEGKRPREVVTNFASRHLRLSNRDSAGTFGAADAALGAGSASEQCHTKFTSRHFELSQSNGQTDTDVPVQSGDKLAPWTAAQPSRGASKEVISLAGAIEKRGNSDTAASNGSGAKQPNSWMTDSHDVVGAAQTPVRRGNFGRGTELDITVPRTTRIANGSGARTGMRKLKLPHPRIVVDDLLADDLQSFSDLFKLGNVGLRYIAGVIGQCVGAERPDVAMRCIDEMSKFDIEAKIIDFNKLLHVFTKSGHFELSLRWWDYLNVLNVTPTNVTYNTMINACAKARRHALAEAKFQEMIRAGIQPCNLSYTAVIVAFAGHGDAESAEKWLVHMRGMGLASDLVIYNAFLNACAKAGDLRRVQWWVSQMVADGLTPNIRTYNACIHACAKVGNTVVAEHFYQQAKASGLRPDLFTFGALIDVYAKVGNVMDAQWWMDQIYEEGHVPSFVCFNSMLNACASAGDGPRAEAWLARMKEVGITPTSVAYNFTIAALAATGNECRLAQMLCDMVKRNIHPDHVTLRALELSLREMPDAEKDVRIRRMYCTIIRLYQQCESPCPKSTKRQRQKPTTHRTAAFVSTVVQALQATNAPSDARLARDLQRLLV